jgi:glycosyltransferase involved in cell wall biosynthesis
MIYLDVTSACRSPLNTGVKRIQRGMHASLCGQPDYHPVCWQSTLRSYRELDKRDRATLEQTREPRGLGLFDSFASLTDPLRIFRDRAALLDLSKIFQPGDVLLVPDLVWDNRGKYLSQIPSNFIRRIGIFHDAIALRLPRQSRIDRYFCRRGIRALAALDGVLCISREAESDLHRYWSEEQLSGPPTRVAPWPIPFAGARPAVTSNFSARRILYVARLEPHKNHLRLLEACSRLWRKGFSFELQLIGCLAYPDTAWKIMRRIRALQRDGFPVHWRAHVSEAELHAAYETCSFTAFPSLLEGFGLPILESLWHGRPVVCGTNGALGELANGGGCEVVNTESVSSIATGLRHLLTDEKRYDDLYIEAQSRAFRTWTDYWSETADFIHVRS